MVESGVLSGVLTALLMSNFRKSHIDMVCVVDAPVAEAEQVKDESLESSLLMLST